MIPVICHGCGQRGKIASIPSDLVCAACRSTDIDLDDSPQRTAAKDYTVWCSKCGKEQQIETPRGADEGKTFYCEDSSCGGRLEAFPPEPKEARKRATLDPSDPMALLPTGTPDQDRDVEPLRESDAPRKVLVPKGSAPYTQRALAVNAAFERLAGPRASCSSCGHEWTSRSPLGPERCPQCSSSDLKSASRRTSAHDMVECWDCGGTGAVPAGGGEAPEDVDNGYVKCPTCDGTGEAFSTEARKQANQDGSPAATGDTFANEGKGGTCTVDGCDNAAQGEQNKCEQHTERDQSSSTASRVDAKVEQIALAVIASNPGMTMSLATKVALKTVARYPKVAG